MRRSRRREFVMLACLAVWPLWGCDSIRVNAPGSTVNQPGDDDASDPGRFVLYTNPDAPLIMQTTTEDNGNLEVYADKDADGAPTRISSIRFQTPEQMATNGETWVFFGDDGRIARIADQDRNIIDFQWTSDRTATVSGVSADGNVQFSTPVDFGTATDTEPDMPPDGGDGDVCPALDADCGGNADICRESDFCCPDDGFCDSDGCPEPDADCAHCGKDGVCVDLCPGIEDPDCEFKTKSRPAMQSLEPIFINVTKCNGDINVANANVSVRLRGLDPQGQLRETFLTASPASSSGLYSVQLPVARQKIDGATAVALCEAFSVAATFTCAATVIERINPAASCAVIAATIDLAIAGPTGEAVPIAALCTAGMIALNFSCATFAAGEVFAPTPTDFICEQIESFVDEGFVIDQGTIDIEALVHSGGAFPVSSGTTTVPKVSPFPVLNVDLGTDPEIGSVTLLPNNPVKGEAYFINAEINCAAGTLVQISVFGDSYSNVHTFNPSGASELFQVDVPATQDDVHVISVRITGTVGVGGDLTRQVVVRFDDLDDTECDDDGTCVEKGLGQACDAGGRCVECVTDNHCTTFGTRRFCDTNNTCVVCRDADDCNGDLCLVDECVECLFATQCPDGMTCDKNNTCVPDSDCNCPPGLVCDDGDCVECVFRSDCPNDQLCDLFGTQTCVECLQDSDCPGRELCDFDGVCQECIFDSDCIEAGLGDVCDSRGRCLTSDDGDVGPPPPFLIVSATADSVIAGVTTGDLTVTWSGEPVFPLRLTFSQAPFGCPPNVLCTTIDVTFEEEQNPLVVPDATGCSAGLDVTFGYQVVLSSLSIFAESNVFPVSWNCSAP